ncbi:MAG: hypothetical protein HY740_05185 [Chloroflexi bacterium]|nr:hypothetical protein [Chloroflexota bacterium]
MSKFRLPLILLALSIIVFIVLGFGVNLIVNTEVFQPPTPQRATPDSRVTPLPVIVLAASPNDQREPAVDGSTVVWAEKINGRWQIIRYDVLKRAKQQITNDNVDHIHPAVSGNIVVWLENDQVASFNLATNTKTILGKAKQTAKPKVDGTFVVWLGESAKSDPLYAPIILYDLKTQKSETLAKNQFAKSPALSGNVVVWEDWRDGNGDIYGYDVSAKQEFAISKAAEDQTSPAIAANTVVWIDNRNTKSLGEVDLYGYDLKNKSEFQISVGRKDVIVDPRLSGTQVVWSSNVQVFAFDLKTNKLRALTSPGQRNIEPALSGNTVVWTRLTPAPAQIVLGLVQ